MPKYQCPKCQATFDKQVKFCPECGEKLEWKQEKEEPKKQKAPAKKDRYEYCIEKNIADINCKRRADDLDRLYGWKYTKSVYLRTETTTTPPRILQSPIHAWTDSDGNITVTGGEVTITGGETIKTDYYDLYFQRDTEDPLYPTWVKADNISDDFNLMCSQVRLDKSGVWFWGLVLIALGVTMATFGAASIPALSPEYGMTLAIVLGIIFYILGIGLYSLGIHIAAKRFYYNRANWRLRRYFIKYLDESAEGDATLFTERVDEYVRRSAYCSYGKHSLILPGNQLHRYCNDPFTKINDMENNYSDMLATLHGIYIDDKVTMERARMSFIWRLIVGTIALAHFPFGAILTANDPEVMASYTGPDAWMNILAMILIALAWSMPFYVGAFYYIKKYSDHKKIVHRYETESSLEDARRAEALSEEEKIKE